MRRKILSSSMSRSRLGGHFTGAGTLDADQIPQRWLLVSIRQTSVQLILIRTGLHADVQSGSDRLQAFVELSQGGRKGRQHTATFHGIRLLVRHEHVNFCFGYCRLKRPEVS